MKKKNKKEKLQDELYDKLGDIFIKCMSGEFRDSGGAKQVKKLFNDPKYAVDRKDLH